MINHGADEAQICQKVVACMCGKAAGFILQMYEMAQNNGWLKWKTIQVGEDAIGGLKFLIKEQFDYFKCLKVVLAKLEGYCQEDEEIEEYLPNSQNLQSESKIPKEFTKRILFKNTREDLVERLIVQSEELSYEAFLKDL